MWKLLNMGGHFRPVRVFLLLGIAAFVSFGFIAFYNSRTDDGRTEDERVAYAIGYKAGVKAPAKLPYNAELNALARNAYLREGSGSQASWHLAFEDGYLDAFRDRRRASKRAEKDSGQ